MINDLCYTDIKSTLFSRINFIYLYSATLFWKSFFAIGHHSQIRNDHNFLLQKCLSLSLCPLLIILVLDSNDDSGDVLSF